MLIVMKNDASPTQVQAVESVVRALGFTPHRCRGSADDHLRAREQEPRGRDPDRVMDGVWEVIHVTKPYKLVSARGEGADGRPGRRCGVRRRRDTGHRGPVRGGGPDAVSGDRGGGEGAAGGCAQGRRVQAADLALRFQGLGEEGLKILAEAREKTGLPVCTEVMDTDTVDLVSEYSDIVQIGARNMHNFSLLKRVGRQPKPVLLKRGLSATINELLMAAEYIMSEGSWQVILCERGIRTFEEQTRNTLDLSAIPIIHELSHLPIIVDPSHASGRWDSVIPLARASVAVGADGLIVEVHQNPAEALSDGPQSLNPEKFAGLMRDIRPSPASVAARKRQHYDCIEQWIMLFY